MNRLVYRLYVLEMAEEGLMLKLFWLMWEAKAKRKRGTLAPRRILQRTADKIPICPTLTYPSSIVAIYDATL